MPHEALVRGLVTAARLGGYGGGVGSVEVAIDDFFGRLFALSTAVRNRKSALNFVERAATALDRFADLSITNSVAETNVHADDTLE